MAEGSILPSDRPTLLMVGAGEPMDRALEQALDRRGLFVERVDAKNVVASVRMTGPDAILLVGDAAREQGKALLAALLAEPASARSPVIVLSRTDDLEARLDGFRHGASAVVPRGASADATAARIADLARELSDRFEQDTGEIGEATFDELVQLVSKELRSGILSVHPPKGETLRLQLGQGRPVSDAVQEFVARLKPHVSESSAVNYQFRRSMEGFLDEEGERAEPNGDLASLRVLLVDDEPSRSDALAQELRARGALVFVTDPEGSGLERAGGLDPQIAIVDREGLEGETFSVVQAIRAHPRLRWASILVAPWPEIWPPSRSLPDMEELVARIEPLVAAERELAERAAEDTKFDTRLEAAGPSRMLRTLVATQRTLHVTVRSPKATVEIDVAEELVVGASAKVPGGPTSEGTAALAVLLTMSSGRVRVEQRDNPAMANIMTPVEASLGAAVAEMPRKGR